MLHFIGRGGVNAANDGGVLSRLLPPGRWEPSVVVLSPLGTWQRRPAYKEWNEYFPNNGKGFGRVMPCRGF